MNAPETVPGTTPGCLVHVGYRLDPKAETEDLLNEFDCVFGAALAAWEVRDELKEEDFATLYLLRHAHALVHAIRERVHG